MASEPQSAPGWTNWSGAISASPQSVRHPATRSQIQEAVREARSIGGPLRVVGTGHSFVPLCASSGVLVSLDRFQGLVDVDSKGGARVLAGTKIYQLNYALRQCGWALENMGDIDRQSIAGALSTATHGTGRELRNLSAQLRELEWIDAAGEVVRWRAGGEQPFDAARVSLGAFGVLSEATLQCVPTYRLHERLWTEPIDQHLEQLEDNIRENRHYEFFYDPSADVANAKALNPVDSKPDPMTSAPGERIDHSDLVLPSRRWHKFNEIEFSLPEAAGLACFREIRDLLRTRYPKVRWPIEYRTVAADSAWLSPHGDRDSVTLSCHEGNRREFREFFRDCEAIFREHGGRPHWGKVHEFGPSDLAEAYPRWSEFLDLRRDLDPDGLFLNSYLASLFGEPVPR